VPDLRHLVGHWWLEHHGVARHLHLGDRVGPGRQGGVPDGETPEQLVVRHIGEQHDNLGTDSFGSSTALLAGMLQRPALQAHQPLVRCQPKGMVLGLPPHRRRRPASALISRCGQRFRSVAE